MASPFDALARLADAACSAAFGRGFRLIARSAPSGDVNARRTPDLGRPSFEAVGVFDRPAGIQMPRGRGMAASHVHGVVAPKATLALTLPLPWRPRRGDIAENLETAERWEVTEVREHSHDVIILEFAS
jgi:hypothetical protein